MKEYIERKAAIDCLLFVCVPQCRSRKYAQEKIKKIPAADVRPVVLCKECRHRDPEDHKCDCGEMERQGCPFKVADDYFCAYGEKREES